MRRVVHLKDQVVDIRIAYLRGRPEDVGQRRSVLQPHAYKLQVKHFKCLVALPELGKLHRDLCGNRADFRRDQLDAGIPEGSIRLYGQQFTVAAGGPDEFPRAFHQRLILTLITSSQTVDHHADFLAGEGFPLASGLCGKIKLHRAVRGSEDQSVIGISFLDEAPCHVGCPLSIEGQRPAADIGILPLREREALDPQSNVSGISVDDRLFHGNRHTVGCGDDCLRRVGYNYPKYDSSRIWVKVPSQELSDVLVEALKRDED